VRITTSIAWLDDLKLDVIKLRKYQRIYRELKDIIAANEALHVPSAFYEYFSDTYVTYISLAIRRLTDDSPDCTSLFRFLKRIKGDPSVVSRQRYKALFTKTKPTNVLEEHIAGMSDHAYDALVGKAKPQPDSSDIQTELDLLREKTEAIVALADSKIAHSIGEPKKVPKYRDVDDAIEYVSDVIKRYLALLHATTNNLDVVFVHDWKKIFRIPWIV
jgi:HEPN superfamily AbiU2-like protein